MKITVCNENRILSIFTNSSYVEGLQNDVLEFSEDLCAKCGIPEDSVNTVIDFKSVLDIQEAYTYGNFGYDEMYSSTTYTDLLGTMNKSIVSSTTEMLSNEGIKIAESQKQDGVQSFADEITAYLQERVEFSYTSEVQSIINISNTIADIGIILFSIFSVAFSLLTLSLTEKKYRSLRSLCFSIFAAADLNLLFVIFIGIVAIFKDFLIYPEYLCQSVLSYIGSCVLTFFIEAALLFLIGLCISCYTWKKKRNSE
jgi:hypothetical protein